MAQFRTVKPKSLAMRKQISIMTGPLVTLVFCLCACGCKDDSQKQSHRMSPPTLPKTSPTPQTLEHVEVLSDIKFPKGTTLAYEGNSRGISGYRSWVLHGARLRDAVLTAVDRGLWSEVSPDTAKKVLANKAPAIAIAQSTSALLGEWGKNGKRFSGILLLCEKEDYLQLELLP